TSGFNIVTDIWILVLPVKTLSGILRPRREKIALGLIFGVGLFATITSVIRLHTIYTYTLAEDVFRESILVNIWSMLEINIGIICASVPALKPLFTPKALREATDRNRRAGYQYHSQERSAFNSNGPKSRDGAFDLDRVGEHASSRTMFQSTSRKSRSEDNDVDAARQALSRETAQGRDVVVIAYSYGGMVGNSVIKGFAPLRDAAKGGSAPATSSTSDDHRDALPEGHAIGLILIASGFTLTGLAFMDPFFGRPPPGWRVNSTTGYAELVADPREFFYHDLPAEEAEFWTSRLTTQSLKALFEGGEHAYAGWQDVPAWYIGTVQDRGLPVVAQRMIVSMAREMGARVEHRELQTSHSPFLSQPENTVSIVLEA
ncbi:hypothetical protein CSHISOI_05361, partial [Colletotrichum shisoi]